MNDLAQFVVLKPVSGGYVYRRPASWPFGSRGHFLVTEEQKAALLATYSAATRAVHWAIWTSWVGLSAASVTALSTWALRSEHQTPGLIAIGVVTATIVSLWVALFISRQVLLRRLRPIVATLAPTTERITRLEARQAVQAQVRAATTFSPTRQRAMRIAAAIAMVGSVGALIARAFDMYGPSQFSLLTLYSANANVDGLLGILVIVTMAFLVLKAPRNPSGR